MKAAVVGLGFGELHVQALKNIQEIEEIILCDIDARLAAKASQKYNLAGWTDSYAEVLQDREVELVTLAVPHFLHYDMLNKAIDMGKHIYCEKPLTINYQQGVEIAERAVKAGIKLTVGYNMRYYEQYMKAKDLIDTDKIGNIFLIECFARADATGMEGFRLSKKKAGGGCLIDSGAHRFDLLRWLFGPLVSVYMRGGTFNVEQMEGEDTAVVSLKFGNGIIGTLNCSWGVRVPEWDEGLKIYGTEGMIDIWDHDLSLKWRQKDGAEEKYVYETTYEQTVEISLQDFITAVTNDDLRLDRARLLGSLQAIEESYRSMDQDRPKIISEPE